MTCASKVFNLRRDPFERAGTNSNGYSSRLVRSPRNGISARVFEHHKVAISLLCNHFARGRDEPSSLDVMMWLESNYRCTVHPLGSSRRSEMATDCISN